MQEVDTRPTEMDQLESKTERKHNLPDADSENVCKTTTCSSPDSTKSGSKEYVWVVARCSFIACLGSLLAGMNLGFSSPALLELTNENLTTPAQHFDEGSVHRSLFGTMAVFGLMFGSLLAWPMADYFGRQTALKVGGIPSLCGWLFLSNSIRITQSAAGFRALLLIGRFLTGFATGWFFSTVSVYIAEISSPKLKGFFGNFHQLFLTLGTAMTYFLSIRFGGYQISYSDIALVGVGVVILFEILMIVATLESPRWLFSKNRHDNGIQVLKTLRGETYQVTKEIDEIKAGLKCKHSIKEQLVAFKHPVVYHPFLLVIFLKCFQQFGGINAAIFYASQIFSAAGYSNDKVNLVSFGAVGCVQVLATLVSVALVDYLGRRILLITSSALMVLSSFLLGIYFFIFDDRCDNSLDSLECPSGIEYLAMASVILFIIGFSLGWGPIPAVSTSELLPYQVRTLGGSIGSFFAGISATIVIFGFPSYVDLVSPKFAWWTFSIILTLAIVIVVLFLPEAKGKSLEEIQQTFEKGHILACSCSWNKKEKTFA